MPHRSALPAIETLDALTTIRLELDDAVFFLELMSQVHGELDSAARSAALASVALDKATTAAAALNDLRRRIERCRQSNDRPARPTRGAARKR